MNEQPSFSYTYSAKEQEEIKAIRKKYAAPETEEDAMTKLRRLDAAVTKKATKAALVLGVLGALILGCGMSMIMTDFAAALGLQGTAAIAVGCVIGVIGLALAAMAYPVYDRLVKKERARIAPEILRLTDELMK